MTEKNVTAIIQARTGSSRLPNKVFADISGKPLMWHVVNRLNHSTQIKQVVLATTSASSDQALVEWARDNNVLVFQGSEQNVLDRFFQAAKTFNAVNILRVTADNPFKDSRITDQVIEMFFEHELDFAYNNKPPTFPEGLDTEVFTFEALARAHSAADDPFAQEHLTQHFYRNPTQFKQRNLAHTENLSHLRWTIDTPKDLEMVRQIYGHLHERNSNFSMAEILALLERHPEIAKINAAESRSFMFRRKSEIV